MKTTQKKMEDGRWKMALLLVPICYLLTSAPAAPAAGPNDIALEWSTVGTNQPAWATNYVLWLGTNSPTGVNYVTNWNVTGTNATIPVSVLQAGKTNYVSVQANTQLFGTNLFIGPASAPLLIQPATNTPVLRFSSSLMFRNSLSEPWREYAPLPVVDIVQTNMQQLFAVQGRLTL